MNRQAGTTVVVLKGPHRSHKRYRTRSLLIDNPVAGRVVNVGGGGLAVETEHGLSVGETYTFKVRFGEKHLRLRGRIQWCHMTRVEDGNGGSPQLLYHAGVALEEGPATRAWQQALQRMTGHPYVVRFHGRSREEPSRELTADNILPPEFGHART